MSDNIKKIIELYTNDNDAFVEMCKKNIEEKVDWHNNTKYNRGMSANERYLNAIFESDKGWSARFKGQMSVLEGKWGSLENNLKNAVKQTKSRPARIVLGFTLTLLALGSMLYMYILNKEHKEINVAKNNKVA